MTMWMLSSRDGNRAARRVVGMGVRRLFGIVGVAVVLAACGSSSSSSGGGGSQEAPTTAPAATTTAPASTAPVPSASLQPPIGANPTAPLAASCTKSGTAGCPPPDGAALQQLVGLTEQQAAAQAAANGWPFRVAERDGERFLLTQDFNEQRVNVAVENGVVTRAWSG
jgi:hypothetical protein